MYSFKGTVDVVLREPVYIDWHGRFTLFLLKVKLLDIDLIRFKKL